MDTLFAFAHTIRSFFLDPAPPSPFVPFTPTYTTVCHARALLQALNLPTELVLQILDHAQYWPHHTYTTAFDSPKIASAQVGRPSHATLCLAAAVYSNPTVSHIRRRGEHPKIKRVDFELVSRDQGWTSENTKGTFATSSWLEVSILRYAHGSTTADPTTLLQHVQLVCPVVAGEGWELAQRPQAAEQGPQGGEGEIAWYLQGNRVAAKHGEYRVVWGLDGIEEGNEGAGRGERFVDSLKEGDRVLVWARAKVCYESGACEMVC